MRMTAPVEIAISRQVWVCDACGCKDNKSCGCDSPAHAEELAAKKEAHRQANRRSYEKTKQNQGSSDNPTPVDNVREFPADYQSPWEAHGRASPSSGDDAPDLERNADTNKHIRRALDFTVEYCNRVTDWHQRTKLSSEDKTALVQTLYQCAERVMQLAQAIDGR